MGIADFSGGVHAALRQRMEDQMAAEAVAEKIRQFEAQGARADRRLDQEDTRLDLDIDKANQPAPEPPPMVVGGRLVTRTGQVLFEPPPTPEKPERPITLSPGGALVDPGTGRIITSIPDRPQAAPAQEPLVPVIGDDGRPVLMPRSQAAGRAPASTREQTGNRPIISGDANRIAEFDTSLDDLDTLEAELGDTGALPQLGALAPNVISEYTGFGTGAKSRQAQIDRVKQVIGKALEGGVLRKEDELKYAKILPTIGDVPDVAKGKLKSLREAITQRQSTLIDSLSDAGYDTSNYRNRPPRQPKTAGAAKPIRQRNAKTGQIRVSHDGGKTWQLEQ